MTFDGIPAFLAGGGITGVLYILFLPYIQMARGKLVPRSAIDDERADTEKWRQAHEVSEKARIELIAQGREMSAQVSESLEHARTVEAFLKALGDIGRQP